MMVHQREGWKGYVAAPMEALAPHATAVGAADAQEGLPPLPSSATDERTCCLCRGWATSRARSAGRKAGVHHPNRHCPRPPTTASTPPPPAAMEGHQ